MPYNRIAALSLAAVGFAFSTASACLRGTLDERAVQWSTQIIEARLAEIGKPINRAHPPATAPTTQAAEQVQIFTFTVQRAMDGAVHAGEQVRVVRFLARDAAPSKCPLTLADKRVGERFVLLLRRADQTQLPAPLPVAVELKDAQVIVHLIKRDEMDDAAVDALQRIVKDARDSAAGASDDSIGAEATTLAIAQDAVEAEEAEKALLKIGPRAIDALRAKLSDPQAPADAKARLQRVIDELTPPPLAAEPAQ